MWQKDKYIQITAFEIVLYKLHLNLVHKHLFFHHFTLKTLIQNIALNLSTIFRLCKVNLFP